MRHVVSPCMRENAKRIVYTAKVKVVRIHSLSSSFQLNWCCAILALQTIASRMDMETIPHFTSIPKYWTISSEFLFHFFSFFSCCGPKQNEWIRLRRPLFWVKKRARVCLFRLMWMVNGLVCLKRCFSASRDTCIKKPLVHSLILRIAINCEVKSKIKIYTKLKRIKTWISILKLSLQERVFQSGAEKRRKGKRRRGTGEHKISTR